MSNMLVTSRPFRAVSSGPTEEAFTYFDLPHHGAAMRLLDKRERDICLQLEERIQETLPGKNFPQMLTVPENRELPFTVSGCTRLNVITSVVDWLAVREVFLADMAEAAIVSIDVEQLQPSNETVFIIVTTFFLNTVIFDLRELRKEPRSSKGRTLKCLIPDNTFLTGLEECTIVGSPDDRDMAALHIHGLNVHYAEDMGTVFLKLVQLHLVPPQGKAGRASGIGAQARTLLHQSHKLPDVPELHTLFKGRKENFYTWDLTDARRRAFSIHYMHYDGEVPVVTLIRLLQYACTYEAFECPTINELAREVLYRFHTFQPRLPKLPKTLTEGQAQFDPKDFQHESNDVQRRMKLLGLGVPSLKSENNGLEEGRFNQACSRCGKSGWRHTRYPNCDATLTSPCQYVLCEVLEPHSLHVCPSLHHRCSSCMKIGHGDEARTRGLCRGYNKLRRTYNLFAPYGRKTKHFEYDGRYMFDLEEELIVDEARCKPRPQEGSRKALRLTYQTSDDKPPPLGTEGGSKRVRPEGMSKNTWRNLRHARKFKHRRYQKK